MANQDYIDLLNAKKTNNILVISQQQMTLDTIPQMKEQMQSNITNYDNQAIEINNTIQQLTNENVTMDEMIEIFST